jgi:hypothetical protein
MKITHAKLSSPSSYRGKRLVTVCAELGSPNEFMTITVAVPNDGTEQVNWPPFRPDTRHNLEGLRLSSSTGLCLTTTNVSN